MSTGIIIENKTYQNNIKNKIKEIRCKKCQKELPENQKYQKSPCCNCNVQYKCECGVMRSYSNLFKHDCEKTKKRKDLKEKFKKNKKKIIKNINDELEVKKIVNKIKIKNLLD
jgi:hypothetical protein